MTDLANERGIVKSDYESAERRNKKNNGSNAKYIYDNQRETANEIVGQFLTGKNVVSVIKETKSGANGLMIELTKIMGTHPDHAVQVESDKMYIITGMSNKDWVNDFRKEVPEYLRDNIHHRPKINEAGFRHNLENSLIIIDEADEANEMGNILPKMLSDTGVLSRDNIMNMKIKMVFISATHSEIIRTLSKWPTGITGTVNFKPAENYISNGYFLDKGLIRNRRNYKLKDIVIDNLNDYGNNYRIHCIRVPNSKSKEIEMLISLQQQRKDFELIQHNSTNNLNDVLNKHLKHKLFVKPLEKHYIIYLYGALRRANLIENGWKMRTGFVCDNLAKKPDDSTVIQGLLGRFTGYWKNELNNDHKFGPIYTYPDAIKRYRKWIDDPIGSGVYIEKKKDNIMTHPKNVNGISHTYVDPNKIPNGLAEFYVKTYEDLNTGSKCNEFLETKYNLKLVKGTKGAREPDKVGDNYTCGYNSSSSILSYKELTAQISGKGNNGSKWSSTFNNGQLTKIQGNNANSNDCIYRRWYCYAGDVAVCVMKVIYKI